MPRRVGGIAESNINWRGDSVSIEGGRQRARRLYPGIHPCSVEGCNSTAERHHIDGNTRNNSCENIAFLCNKHHKEADGRMSRDSFRSAWRRAMQGRKLTAEHRRKISEGLKGREMSEMSRAKLSASMRRLQASKPAPTHCKHGHPFTADNLKILKNGCRWCRECARQRSRRDYHAKRGAA